MPIDIRQLISMKQAFAVARLLAKERMVLFGGAGVSRESGLPIASELIEEILNTLRVTKSVREALKASTPPFELIIETLASCSDVTPLYEIYTRGFPCLFHSLSAALYQKSLLGAVLTTNFDILFEKCFECEGLNYVCVWREADLEKWEPAQRKLSLLKLHGSVHDIDSLGATIQRVARQKGVKARESVLRQTFLQMNAAFILVAGYSGSDRFDINPALARIGGLSSPIVLVAHNPNMDSSVVSEALIGNARAGPFSEYQGVRIECDTNILLREILACLGVSSSQASMARGDWKEGVRLWGFKGEQELGTAFRPYAIGLLLRAAARPKDARYWFRRASDLANSVRLNIDICLCLSRCERDVGQNLLAARKYAQLALQKSESANLPAQQCAALIELGVIAADQKQYKSAISCYQRAEKLARSCNEIEKVGICVGNAGIARKNLGGVRNWKRALKDFEEALSIACETGDKRSEGRTIGNLGILHSVMGKPKLAIKNFKIAAAIARELGDRYHEAIWLVGEAHDTFESDKAAAITLVLEAREIFLPLSEARVRDCDEHLLRFRS